MTPTKHPVPVVIGLTLAVVVTAGTAAAATRQPTSPRAAITAPASVSVSAVTYSRPHVQRGATTHRPPHKRRHISRATVPTPAAPHTAAKPHRTAPPRRHHPAAITGPTGWPALDEAIARIPTYRAGAAMWLVSSKYGYWGTADWYHDRLFIAPGVPDERVYDVAVHEWSHELTVLDYAGDVDAAVRAMNMAFGGSGLTGAERAADCMAILQGATWTHYTSCSDTAWRRAAAKLVAGQQL